MPIVLAQMRRELQLRCIATLDCVVKLHYSKCFQTVACVTKGLNIDKWQSNAELSTLGSLAWKRHTKQQTF